jgi:hypothetical protein
LSLKEFLTNFEKWILKLHCVATLLSREVGWGSTKSVALETTPDTVASMTVKDEKGLH